jgi:hypothetical protein
MEAVLHSYDGLSEQAGASWLQQKRDMLQWCVQPLEKTWD